MLGTLCVVSWTGLTACISLDEDDGPTIEHPLITLSDSGQSVSDRAYAMAWEDAEAEAKAAGADPFDTAQVNPYFLAPDIPSDFSLSVEIPSLSKDVAELRFSVGAEPVAVYLAEDSSQLRLAQLSDGYDAPATISVCAPRDEESERACIQLRLTLNPRLMDLEAVLLSIIARSDSGTVEYRAVQPLQLEPHFLVTVTARELDLSEGRLDPLVLWFFDGHPPNVNFFSRDGPDEPWNLVPWAHASETLATTPPSPGQQLVACPYGYNPFEHRGKCSNVLTSG